MDLRYTNKDTPEEGEIAVRLVGGVWTFEPFVEPAPGECLCGVQPVFEIGELELTDKGEGVWSVLFKASGNTPGDILGVPTPAPWEV